MPAESDFMVLRAQHDNHRFKIEEDLPEIGWYLYVYNQDGECIADHQEQDLQTIMDLAEEEYGVSLDDWN